MISAKYRTYHIKIVVLCFVFITKVHFTAPQLLNLLQIFITIIPSLIAEYIFSYDFM
jgi:hypothetical protein